MNIKTIGIVGCLIASTLSSIAQEFTLSGEPLQWAEGYSHTTYLGLSVSKSLACFWNGRGDVFTFGHPASRSTNLLDLRKGSLETGVMAAGDGYVYGMADYRIGMFRHYINAPPPYGEDGFLDYYYVPTRMISVGSKLYVATGNDVTIMNIVEPFKDDWLNIPRTRHIGAFVEDLTVSDGYVYTASSTGLKIIDDTNPDARFAKLVGSWDSDAYGFCVAASHGRAYLGTETGLRILDVSDPTHPVLLGSYNAGGKVSKVEAQGDYVYMITDLHSLEMLNVSDPARPVVAGSLNLRPLPTAIGVTGPYIYLIAMQFAPTPFLIDLTPTHPQATLRTQSYTPGTGLQLSVRGTPGAKAQLQRSTDCKTWSSVGSELTLGFEPSAITDPDPNTKAFYRTLLP